MSQSTKRKHVTKEVLDEFRLPQNNEKIVQIIAGRGNNLHEVYDPNCESVSDLSLNQELGANKYLVSMPTKFRKNVWIKRLNRYHLMGESPILDLIYLKTLKS